MSQENMVIIAIVAIVAFIIGLLVGKAQTGGAQAEVAQQKAKDAEQLLSEYKSSVSEHFGKTADLVDNLTQSYKDVFEHLGSSARELLSEEEVNKHLQSRADKAVTLTYLADKDTAANPMAQAQAEIQSEKAIDKAASEAEKMAASLKSTPNPEETKEKPDDSDVAKKTAELIAEDKAKAATPAADETAEKTAKKDDKA